MSGGVNKVILVGNLGRDPEVSYSQSGLAICRMRLAVTERVKKGEAWEDRTEWVTLTAFGKTGENAGQYLGKGRQIYVEGRLSTRSYKDKEGVEKWSTEVVVDQLVYLGSPGDKPRSAPSNGTNGKHATRSADVPARGGDTNADPGFIDDDLPF